MTEESIKLRDLIRQAPETCGENHSITLICSKCNELIIKKSQKDAFRIKEVYRIEREAENPNP